MSERTDPQPETPKASPDPRDDLDAAEASARSFVRREVLRAASAFAQTRGETPEESLQLADKVQRAIKTLETLRAAAPKPLAQALEEEQAARAELLARIEHALEGGRQARRAEVETLQDYGVDPREGWLWDEDAGEWIWDAQAALARARGEGDVEEEGEVEEEERDEEDDEGEESS